jgi:MIP family channel proteins
MSEDERNFNTKEGVIMTGYLKQCVAEFLGTFFLVFVGCTAVIVSQLYEATPSLTIPLAFGGVVSVMIYAVGHLSGGHFNPAVTLGFAVTRHFPIKHLVGYWIAQCAGAVLASGLDDLIFGNLNHNFGATSFQISTATAFGVEVVLTFMLMFVIISVATDTRAKGEMAGLAIGSTVAIAAIVGGSLTGASMNPARSLAPALFAGELRQLWLYILAPCVGAVLGACVYEKIRK